VNEQQAFAKVMMECGKEGKLVIYLDETSFNMWQNPSKLWLKKGQTVPMQNNRGSSAIS
jgi:hypothetical protein